MKKYLSVLVLLALTYNSVICFADEQDRKLTTRALNIPSYYVDYLPQDKLNFVKDYLNNKIAIYTPEQLFVYIGNNNSKILSAGYNGIAVKTDRVITKVSFYGMINTNHTWGLIPKITNTEVIIPQVETTVDALKLVKEIVGHLIWMTYDKTTLPPISISTDLQALQRHHEYGIPLNEILKSNQYHDYDKNALWKEVVRIQNLAERMLIETGLIIDLVNPGNFIVAGGKERPLIANIDFELMRASQETIDYYQAKGIRIPKVYVPKGEYIIPWPHMPESILVNKLWSLTYEQSLDYIKAKYDIKTNHEAIRILARMPKYKNSFASEREFFDNIDLAKKNKKPQPFVVGACRNYLIKK